MTRTGSISVRDEAYAAAARLCPQSVDLYAGYSSSLLAQGEFAKALEVASSGLRQAPADSKLILNQAIALYSIRRMRESLVALRRLPESAEALFYEGLNYRRLGEHAEARKCLRQAWDSGYRDPFLLYSLIEEDHTAGDKAAGLADFQLMLRQYADSAWLHMALGNAAFVLEKDQQARTEYGRALALNPRLPNANFRLGYLAYQARDDDAAARYFRNELAVDPQHSDASLFLGQTLRHLGRNREAIVYLRQAMALDPASGLAFGTLGTALMEMNQLNEALEVLTQGEKRFPDDPTFPAQLARLLARLDRNDDAQKAAERARLLLAQQRKKQEIPLRP